LRYAAEYNNFKIAALVLELGADINFGIHSYKHKTPLEYACESGNLEMVEFLMHNMDFDISRFALKCAVASGNIKLVQFLLEQWLHH